MEEDIIEYWIWLQQVFGANSPKPDKLLRDFGSVGEIYRAKRLDYINEGFLNEREIRALCDKSLEKSEAIVSKCIKNGYKILCLNDLPERLRNIYAPPCVLYVLGELPQQEIYISVVGTRSVTPYGVEAATKLSEGLARCGTVVVSGMAVGVDAAAHKGALKGGGKTVAVVACGLDINYPAQHTELKRLIAQNGAVVSEYPPGTRPTRANFPIRNRIIAGLSLGCVVVEAGRRSGALITASLAGEMGRDIFAVPGSIFSPESAGTNRLLRDGAKPVCNVLDILEEYIGLCPQSILSEMAKLSEIPRGGQLSFEAVENNTNEKTAAQKSAPTKDFDNTGADAAPSKIKDTRPHAVKTDGLSETQLKVYNVLTAEPQHVDDIAVKANLELRTVLAVLTTLEIEGYVESLPGKRYAAFA